MADETGFFPDMSRDEYDAVDAMNYSSIKYGRPPLTMADYNANINSIFDKEVTDAMKVGTATHERVYQPYLYEKNFCVEPDIPAGKTRANAEYKGNKKKLEAEGKEILKVVDMAMVEGMWKSLTCQRDAAAIIDRPGHREASFVWIDPESGLLCKGRADEVSIEEHGVSDLKTSKNNVSDRQFLWTIRDFSYDIQAAFYLDGLNEVGIAVDTFTWLAVPKKWPYTCNVIDAPKQIIDEGRALYKTILMQVKRCRESGVWEGHGGRHELTMDNNYIEPDYENEEILDVI